VRITSLIEIGIFYEERESFSKHSQLGSEASHLRWAENPKSVMRLAIMNVN